MSAAKKIRPTTRLVQKVGGAVVTPFGATNDGWPTRETPGPVSAADPRIWAEMDDHLKKHGSSLVALCKLMGKKNGESSPRRP